MNCELNPKASISRSSARFFFGDFFPSKLLNFSENKILNRKIPIAMHFFATQILRVNGIRLSFWKTESISLSIAILQNNWRELRNVRSQFSPSAKWLPLVLRQWLERLDVDGVNWVNKCHSFILLCSFHLVLSFHHQKKRERLTEKKASYELCTKCFLTMSLLSNKRYKRSAEKR